MRISGKTRVCAIIGDPVEHSLSPVMHNAAFKELGLNLVYVAFTVTAKELKTAVLGTRSMGFKGLNVTMPHKNAVMNYLDDVDATAKSIGAVNTVLSNHGKLIGYNTDGNGAMIALQENGVYPEEKKLVLLGAGGAAKAIAYQAAQDVDELVILNRTAEKAKKLAESVKSFGAKIKCGTLSSKVLTEELETADILVNATSVGMHPNVESSPVPSDLLHSDLCVMDIIYNPLHTKLLNDAKAVKAKVVSGIEMLIYQGAVAFEIWTNCPAPVEVMRQAALKELKKQGVKCDSKS
ncbi:MAG: shikimate dehydrogenase [Candidatus Bathyarchaeum sp.]|nr:MAG: shikimate dehydrogenase [Candidatus Bathyarchaeum sp.]